MSWEGKHTKKVVQSTHPYEVHTELRDVQIRLVEVISRRLRISFVLETEKGHPSGGSICFVYQPYVCQFASSRGKVLSQAFFSDISWKVLDD